MRYVEPVNEEITVEAEPSVVIVYCRRPRKTYTHYTIMVHEDTFTYRRCDDAQNKSNIGRLSG